MVLCFFLFSIFIPISALFCTILKRKTELVHGELGIDERHAEVRWNIKCGVVFTDGYCLLKGHKKHANFVILQFIVVTLNAWSVVLSPSFFVIRIDNFHLWTVFITRSILLPETIWLHVCNSIWAHYPGKYVKVIELQQTAFVNMFFAIVYPVTRLLETDAVFRIIP